MMLSGFFPHSTSAAAHTMDRKRRLREQANWYYEKAKDLRYTASEREGFAAAALDLYRKEQDIEWREAEQRDAETTYETGW